MSYKLKNPQDLPEKTKIEIVAHVFVLAGLDISSYVFDNLPERLKKHFERL